LRSFFFYSGTGIIGLCWTFLDENSANKIDVKEYQFFIDIEPSKNMVV